MNGPPGDYPPGKILNDTQSLRMGEASSGLYKKVSCGVGWMVFHSSSEVDCLQRKTDEPVKKFF